MAGSTVLGGLLLMAWLWVAPGEEPLAMQPDRPQAAPRGRQEVRGMEMASETKELHNPFTPAHETAAEAEEQSSGGAKEDHEVKAPPQPPKIAETPAVPPQSSPAAPVSPAMPVLQGIADGAGGRLAMLNVDGRTVTLGEGESEGGWQVQRIERERVQLSGPGGAVWLALKMP